jgi:hypothetical protein
LILPNFSWRSQRWSADVQEWQGQCMWVAWEDATGSGLTAEEVAIGTLLSMIEDADARRQDSAPG